MTAPLLQATDVRKTFGGFTALNNVSITVAPGERLGLIGPNGSGKSTLVNCLSGTLTNDGGRVEFDGRVLDGLAPHKRAYLGLARSFQLPKPFGSLSVRDNLRVPLLYTAAVRLGRHRSEKELRERSHELLSLVGLEPKADAHPADLTQVDMRKLELARAMAAEPKLLIADEAMAGLSGSEVDDILRLLMTLNARGISIIMIEHIMKAVMAFSERLVVLVSGTKIADGAPAEVIRNEDVVRAYLANSLLIEGLGAGYGAVRVLEDVSMHVDDGETVALLGTNGNGKSTLIKCIVGLVKPMAGRVVATVDGVAHDLARLETEDIVDLGIALVPEGRRLFPKLTVEENLLLGASRAKARPALTRNLDFCYTTFGRLKERRSQLAGSMSGGEQQMLALGRALMLSPRILLVDEPSVGLAPILVSRTIDAIRDLKEQLKLTVLMAEQNFTQAIRIADRGYVIVHGHIAYEGKSAAEINDNEMIRKLYLGV